ncbi:malonyl CoA-acyl carrier protein transacylase [Klebsiella pneumoniae]|uniref:[acyl-carrier-protein] S-malonyltransferase n=1 Tax=Klebsiella pneumoniae TaxID=573 RepID=A0A378B9V0_KLEPN|nr:malonyl CoA-acyl carrier protein transacylase [Klebsiella pneumoniae]
MVSGLSIGAFPAAVIAGALDFASALRLVALRGDLMEQAYPEGYGLTAIMGLTRPRVEALMQGHEVYLANLNAETQFVIAGRDEAMAEVAQLALRAGASKAQRLAVSVPSHCALLDKPAAELAKAFARRQLKAPTVRLFKRLDGARAVGSAADRRRSGDEHGAPGPLAGGDGRRR